MGFRKGAYAKIWEVSPVSDVCTKVRMSISKKAQDGTYTTDFSGFVFIVGTAAASKAAKLKEGDKIRVGETDVSTKYDKKAGKNYTNFKMFDFELPQQGETQAATKATAKAPTQQQPDSGEADGSQLPF